MTNLKREKFVAISNIAVMTITFLVLGLFIFVIAGSQTAIRNLEKQAQITLFFKDDFAENDILELKSRLEADERISQVNYVSKEDAFRLFTEINKEEPVLLESITASILPASLEVKSKSLDNLTPLSEELGQLDGVEEVKFFKDIIDTFKTWSKIAYTVGGVLVSVFLLLSFSVIMVTLRLTINAKGKELEILKLVGASDDYVKKPLIEQSVFYGMVSSLIASSILIAAAVLIQLLGVYTGNIEFGFFPDLLLSVTIFTIILSFVLICIGFCVGYFGSLGAIKRYLKY